MLNNSNIKIGADPEFLICNDVSTISVDLNITGSFGSAGTDHGGRCGELRPKHGNPVEVTDNIKNLILKIKNKYTEKKMISGGGTYKGQSIGGHIHISGTNFKYDKFNKNISPRMTDNEVVNNYYLIYALDYFIGRRLSKVNGGKRPTRNYGQPLDVRHQSWGFEYRTPPSWLSEPKLTESTLAIAFLIANLWQHNNEKFNTLIKRVACKNDYAMLLDSEVIPANEINYFKSQIVNFKSIVFSKEYDMDKVNCFETWSTPEITIDPISTKKSKTKIELQKCVVKLYEISNDYFVSTKVVRVCNFVVPEVQIICCNVFYIGDRMVTPKINTIYINKKFRPFLKIKRELNVKIRFVEDIIAFNENRNDCFIFDNNVASNLLEKVKFILTNCIRKKIKKGLDN